MILPQSTLPFFWQCEGFYCPISKLFPQYSHPSSLPYQGSEPRKSVSTLHSFDRCRKTIRLTSESRLTACLFTEPSGVRAVMHSFASIGTIANVKHMMPRLGSTVTIGNSVLPNVTNVGPSQLRPHLYTNLNDYMSSSKVGFRRRKHLLGRPTAAVNHVRICLMGSLRLLAVEIDP